MRRISLSRIKKFSSNGANYSTSRSLLALERVSVNEGRGGSFHTVTIAKAEEENVIRSESGISLMRSLKPHDAEAFYFQDDGKNFCRLCLEEITVTTKFHIAASSRQSHTNHTCREVVLDSLTLWSRRGFKVDNIVQCWSHALMTHKEFPRIPSLTDWRWPVIQRAKKVHDLLAALRDMGYIDLSLAIAPIDNTDANYQTRRRLAFERLECLGDNSWGSNMSNRMLLLFPDRQWIHSQSAYSFNCFRDACEMNLNLEVMYELFDMGALLPPTVREKVGTGKVKADVFESVLGELQVWMWGFEPELYDSAPYIEVNGEAEATVFGILQHVITEMYDVVMLAYCQELSATAIPLSKELASKHVWATDYPVLMKTKDRGGAAKRRTYNSRKTMLPAFDVLPQSASEKITLENPLRDNVVPETIDRFTHRDVFEVLIPSMEISEPSKENSILNLEQTWRKCIATLKLPIVSTDEEGDVSHLAAADEDDVYFRDKNYDLMPAPTSPKHESAARTSTVGSAGDVDDMLTPFPYLATVREGLQQLQGLVIGGTVCLYEQSALVPSDVRSPNAGVITDKNLFLGVFLNQKIEPDTSIASEYF